MSISGKVASLIQDNDAVVIAAAFFTLLGATIFTQKFLSFSKLLLDIFVIPGTSLKKYGAGNGAWAVITGSSDGIGKEFAQQLAAAKFNILLISRTQSKLEAIAADLEQKYAIETKIYAMDFTKGDPKDFENLRNIISQIDVGVLVNNVAMSHEIPTPFVEESEEVIQNMVETNISGLLKVTKITIPVMAARKRGLIINIGSFNGRIPAPYLSVYSGSKAFMSAWSAAIGMELKPKGILVQHVNTYFVATAMSKIRKATWLIPFPKPYVKSVLTKIGVPGGAADVPFSTNTYTPHAIGNWFVANTFSLHYWIQQSFAIHTDIRRRALRKREREAAASKNQ